MRGAALDGDASRGGFPEGGGSSKVAIVQARDASFGSLSGRGPTRSMRHRGLAEGRSAGGRQGSLEAVHDDGSKPLGRPRLRKLLRYESALWATGVMHVAGVDEAGMSPLAGPVSAAAVVFAPRSRIRGVDDSKKLDAAARERLAREIKDTAVAWSVGFAEVEEIDTINIYWAGLLAMRRAVEGLAVTPQHVLLDARRLKELRIPQHPIVKGDCGPTIAAASILARRAAR